MHSINTNETSLQILLSTLEIENYCHMKIAQEVKISDNGFVFNSKTGDSFSLNPPGLEMIKMISEGKEMEEIREAFTSKYEVDELTFEKDFYEFCTLLKHHQVTIQGNPLEFI